MGMFSKKGVDRIGRAKGAVDGVVTVTRWGSTCAEVILVLAYLIYSTDLSDTEKQAGLTSRI